MQLLERASDTDILRENDYVAQRLMELDVESLCGAAHSERSGERENCRNDYRDGTPELGSRRYTTPIREVRWERSS